MKDKHDMRVLLGRMRTGISNYGGDLSKPNIKKKELTMRDFLGKTRKLNEDFEKDKLNQVNKATDFDKNYWIDRFNNYFEDLNITISSNDVFDLEVYDTYVFWGANVLGEIQFLYSVTDNDDTSGAQFNYADDFNAENDDNKEIVKRIELFYGQFSEYWRKNGL